MILLGVDPGFSITGFGVMKKEAGKTTIVDYGVLKFSATAQLPEKIGQFHRFFSDKVIQWNIDSIALETPFLGKNASNFLKLGYLRGILYLIAHENKLSLQEYAPREVKLAVTGSGAADKAQVARVMTRLFQGLEVPDKLDVTDALAIALCGVWKHAHPTILQK